MKFNTLFVFLNVILNTSDKSLLVIEQTIFVLSYTPGAFVGLDIGFHVIVLLRPVIKLQKRQIVECLCLHRCPFARKGLDSFDRLAELSFLSLDKSEAVLVVTTTPLNFVLLLRQLLACLKLIDLKDVQFAQMAEVLFFGFTRVEV